MTDRQVGREIARWQQRLQLQDWQIGWEFVGGEDMECSGAPAEIAMNTDYRSACIRIARGSEDGSVLRYIRHEMLHLVLVDVDPVFTGACEALSREGAALLSDQWNSATERTVTRLERAFETVEPLCEPGTYAMVDPRR